jgi:hypothetical protein
VPESRSQYTILPSSDAVSPDHDTSTLEPSQQ